MQEWTVDLGDGVPVVVFYPSPWSRREVIEVDLNDWSSPDIRVVTAENEAIPHQITRPECVTGARPRVAFLTEVPPLGYKVYWIVDEPAVPHSDEALPLKASATLLQARFDVQVNPDQIKTYRISRSGEVPEVNFLED